MKTPEFARIFVIALAVLLSSCSSTPEKQQSGPAPASQPAAAVREFGPFAVTPKDGGAHEQVFTVRLERSPGQPVPMLVGLLINKAMSGEDACYVFHSVDEHRKLLVNDSGDGSREVGSAASVGNKQCELLGDQTAVTVAADALTATYHVRFKPGFAGLKQLYTIAADANGGGSVLRPMGQFTVK